MDWIYHFSYSYDDKDNTWEPEQNLDCPSLIKGFEAEKAAKEKEKNSRKRKAEDGNKKGKDDKKLHGFDRGLEPEKIIGATDSSGNIWMDHILCTANGSNNFSIFWCLLSNWPIIP